MYPNETAEQPGFACMEWLSINMKITIEFTSSTHATLTIDGREMAVEMKPGVTSLTGIKLPETEETIGGIVASELYSKIGDIMQAWATASDFGEFDTWDKLTEEAAEAVGDRVW